MLVDKDTIVAHRDLWIRGKEDFYVENQGQSIFTTKTVSHYFRPNTKEWDGDCVRLAFNNVDSIAILNTRIPRTQGNDRLAWNALMNGHYSVKGAYHFWQSQNN